MHGLKRKKLRESNYHVLNLGIYAVANSYSEISCKRKYKTLLIKSELKVYGEFRGKAPKFLFYKCSCKVNEY